jgi:hypothetical protein
MPLYPVKNLKTGEEQELDMSIANYTEWRKNNPDWDKDWSKGCAASQEVGDWRNKLTSKHPSWNTILDRAGKMPGSTVKKL